MKLNDLTQKIPPTRLFFGLLSAFLCSPFADLKADHFRIINDPAEALQCRIDLIQQAKHEILVSYYIIKDDAAGKCILGLLADAAQRGVRIRVLMDSNASRISRKNLLWLRIQGLQIRKFRIRSDVRRFWHRLHDKILLVDFKTMIVGGRNLKDEYFGLGKKFNFEDRDALIRSDSAVYTARAHFYSIWNRPHLSRDLRSLPERTPQEMQAIAWVFSDNRQRLRERLSLQFDTGRDWFSGLAPTQDPVQFIHDDFFRKRGNKMVETTQKDLGSTRALIQIVEQARHSIVLETPYCSPTRLWRKAFKKAVARGVSIRIRTNSARTTDVWWHYFRYQLMKNRLLGMGLVIEEYRGREKLHAKAMAIDDAIAVVGSYNLHLHSQYYNTEVAVWVRDPCIAKALEQSVKGRESHRPE
jgi:cardiolipin synthase C